MSDKKHPVFGPEFGADLSSFIEAENNETTRKLITDNVAKSMEGLPGVEHTKITYCGTLWKRMTLWDKVRWFAYNRFPFAHIGSRLRQEIIELHFASALRWKNEGPDRDFSECPFVLKYPAYLEPSPKSMLVVDALVKLHAPIDYVIVDMKLDGLKATE